jgi:tripartite-type tricarboxylate transporter receptor subunit TctC
MTEALGQELDYYSFFAVATTKGVSKPIVDRLTREVHAALADPSIARRLVEMGGSPAPTSGADTARFVESQVKRWKDVVAAAGIQAQ